MNRRLTAVVKPVSSSCNLRCEYCYNDEEMFVPRDNPQKVIGLSTIETTFEECRELSFGTVRFIWHGGEPLLRGLSFYQQVRRLQERIFSSSGIRVINSVQTNATLIDKEWAAFAKESGWGFGVSIDGPPNVHNAFRVDRDGHGSFEDTWSGVQTLLAAGVRVSANAVVSSASIKDPEGVYAFLRNNFRRFDFSPCITLPQASGNKVFAIDPTDYSKFITNCFKLWWEEDNPSVRVRSFSTFVQAALGRTPKLCSMSNGCGRFLCLETDGSVFPCGRFGGISEFLLGNVHQTRLEDILQSSRLSNYLGLALRQSDNCISCRWQHACHNGCAFRRYVGKNQFVEKDPLCEATCAILDFVAAQVAKAKIRLENAR